MRVLVSLIVLLGSSMSMVKGQQDPRPIDSLPDLDTAIEQAEAQVPPFLPPDVTTESDEDDEMGQLLRRAESVDNMEDFLLLLRNANGSSVTMDDLEQRENEGNISTIAARGRMAVPDNCSPRNMTVKLEVANSMPNTIIFPKCTRVERCGGCVKSPHLSCEPAYTERIALRVLQAKQTTPGSPYLTWLGFQSVLVLRHTRCHLVCQLNQEKCGPLKTFRRAACICSCTNPYQHCAPPKVFNPETCQCECIPATKKCGCPDEGPCRVFYDTNICECNLINGGRTIGDNTEISAEDMAAYMNATDQQNQASVDLAPETSTTTVTTTETTTTTPAPCEARPCPRNFVPIEQNGQCRCTPGRTSISNRPSGSRTRLQPPRRPPSRYRMVASGPPQRPAGRLRLPAPRPLAGRPSRFPSRGMSRGRARLRTTGLRPTLSGQI